jgi:type IV pilus assembly protein PilA
LGLQTSVDRRTEVDKRQTTRSQSGFTLIELLAVMAIIAILAAIVAPSVSGTKNTSQEAQAAQDGIQVRNAATEYFSDQNVIEGLTTQATSTLLGVTVATNSEAYTGSNSSTSTIASQKTSSRWPELFITSSSTSTSVYRVEFPITATSTDIVKVYVVDKDDNTIGASTLFGKYTAVDTSKLVSDGYMEVAPDSAASTTTLSTETPHQFLWLFKKSKSPGSPTEDARDVTVFKLESTEKSGSTYTLKYKQIF